MKFAPSLEPRTRMGLHLLADPHAAARGLLVAFADRRGGISRPPFDTLNLAARVGDERAAVDENRARAAAATGLDLARLALARQVHGRELREVGPGDSGVLGDADGLIVRSRGATAAMLTADCAPVVVAGEDGVAVLHAGWRGLVAGIIAGGVGSLLRPYAAWIGPSIRSCCYEVGPDVVHAFEAAGLPIAEEGRVDTAEAARAALGAAGVEHVAVAPVCTHCDPNSFSYRRDGRTGRQGAFGGLLAA